MKNAQKKFTLKHFVISILIVDVVLLILAGFISSAFNLNFSIIILLIGILLGGAGALLGGPDPFDPNNPRNLQFKYNDRPNQLASDQLSYNKAHLVPRFSFENVMLYAGLVAVGIGILVLLFLNS